MRTEYRPPPACRDILQTTFGSVFPILKVLLRCAGVNKLTGDRGQETGGRCENPVTLLCECYAGVAGMLCACSATWRTPAQRNRTRLAATGEAADAVALLTSPVRRVRETADLLRPALPVRGVAVAPGLMELVPGAADGLTLARPAPSPAGWQSAAPPPARSSSPPTATANSPGRRAGRRAAWRPRASPPARSTA